MCFIKKAFISAQTIDLESDERSFSLEEEQLNYKKHLYEPFSGFNSYPSNTAFSFNVLSQLFNSLAKNAADIQKLDEVYIKNTQKCSESTLMLDEACREAEKEPER